MPCINGDTWNSMTEAQQEAVTEAMEYARDVNDTARLDREAELIKFFEEKGLTVTYPDINEFKEKVQAKYMENEDMIKDWDMIFTTKSRLWLIQQPQKSKANCRDNRQDIVISYELTAKLETSV